MTFTLTVRDEFVQTLVLTLIRDLTFEQERDGYRATLTLREATSEGAGSTRALAGVAPFRDVPMVFHLDSTGAILRIDSVDTLWTRFCNGIADQATGDDAQRQLARVALETLRAAPPAQRTAMFIDLLKPALAPHEAAQGVIANQPVSTAADSPLGGSATLSGRRRAWREGDLLAMATHVEGDAPVPGAGDEKASAHIIIDTHAHVDPATGLLRDRRERTIRTTAEGTRIRTVETILR